MCTGVQVYKKFVEIMDQNDFRQIKQFLMDFEQRFLPQGLSFYVISAMLDDLDIYSSRLGSQDTRGIKSSKKGSKKKDVLAVCSRLIRKLREEKKRLKCELIARQKDYREEYKGFISRSLTRDLDLGMVTNQKTARKVRKK